jgi:hypothetical protein
MSADAPSIHGTYDPRFAAVRETFAGHLTSGVDVGASVAVCLDGEMVVDLWGGFADGERYPSRNSRSRRLRQRVPLSAMRSGRTARRTNPRPPRRIRTRCL